MITETTMLYLYVETPLHAGVGSGLSSIDLPIQRERTTQYPMIQGSGIKGKLRSIAYAATKGEKPTWTEEQVNIVFGPEKEASEYAGALIAGDARILLFPVRSLNGVFAYTTSCDILSRFKRDIERGHVNSILPWNIPEQVAVGNALMTTTSEVHANNTIVLEEFSFEARSDGQADAIADWIATNVLPDLGVGDYWTNKVKSSLVILSNDDFRDFALYATEVITRVRIIRDTKTVQSGALWTEEHLPTDTMLYVPIYATDARQNGKNDQKMDAEQVLKRAKSLGSSEGSYLQLGGDETVGRGLVRMRWGS